MGQLLLLTIGALVVAAIGFGIAVLISGSDPGLQPVEPEGRAVPLPASRPLLESDFASARFDTVLRGYRMAQVDTALYRAAYDIGYKQELIGVLEAEVEALRDGRMEDADKLRAAREAALRAVADGAPAGDPAPAGGDPAPAPDATSVAPATTKNGTAKVEIAKVASRTDRPAGPDDATTANDGAEEDSDPVQRPQEMRLP
jgi:DivIVA domain-containing protein